MKLFVQVLLCCVIASATTKASAQEINQEHLDRLFDWLEKEDQAMGSICIMRAGVPMYTRAIGSRSIAGNVKKENDVDTKFRIWSITKMYTATMTMQLVAEGRLTLQTTLATFFPQVSNARMISIAQMLSHTSGIHDFTNPSDDSVRAISIPNDPGIVGKIASFKSDFTPGERFEYSNSNYVLLGYILEKIEGKTYAEILQKRIVSTGGLADTYYGSEALKDVNNKAETYRYENGRWEAVDEGIFSAPIPGPAGSIVASAKDLATFIDEQFQFKFLSTENLTAMMPVNGFYGYGMFKMPFADQEAFGHTGGYLASHSFLVHYPKASLSIAYCTNGERYPMQQLMEHVMNILFDPNYVLPFDRIEKNLTDEQLASYVGSFDSPRFKMNVRVEEKHLVLEAEGQPMVILCAENTQDHFFFKTGNIHVEFERNIKGKVIRLWLVEGGVRMMEGKRLP